MTNPITGATAAEFLTFYAIVIAVIAMGCRLWRTRSDEPSAMPPPPAPTNVDPYEIAYFRGGENELTRVVIVGLIARKYLHLQTSGSLSKEQRIVAEDNHPPREALGKLERDVFELFNSGRRAQDVFKEDLLKVVRPYALPYEQRMRANGFISSDETKSAAWTRGFIGVAVIVAIGLARAAVGLSRDRPIGFLILMGIAGVIVTLVCSKTPRLSKLGAAYLDSLRSTWSSVKVSDPSDNQGFVLSAAVFGITALAGTPYGPVNDFFKKSQSSAAASCGAFGGCSGGGSGDGGGGGGGGCGGCGGG